MQNLKQILQKKLTYKVAIPTLAILLGIIALFTFLLVNSSLEKDSKNDSSEDNSLENEKIEDVVSFPVSYSSNSNPDEILRDYKEIIQNNIPTGIFVKDLDSFTIQLSEPYCDGIDTNIIMGFYEDELVGYPNFDREYIGFRIANREIVGDAKFEEILQRTQSADFANNKTQIIQTNCVGGANESKISFEPNFKSILNNLYSEISVGGYQYLPQSDEALSFSSSTMQIDDNNIITVESIVKDSSLVKFSDVTGIESCITNENIENGVDIDCVATILPNDTANLNKLLNRTKELIDDLLLKNY